MKSSARNISLETVNGLLGGAAGLFDDAYESIQQISVEQLHTFKGHPFHVNDDEAMKDLVASILRIGVTEPAIARPDNYGGYEVISGHRRLMACKIAQIATIPVIVRNLDDDEAVIQMVEANLQHRETLLFSEKAFAYKMKLEAIKHQGQRSDLTSAQVGPKLTAAEKIAVNSPDSKTQIKRLIHLTELIPELLELVDSRTIALNPAYEISFLQQEEQQWLLDIINSEVTTPSYAQAKSLKEASINGTLTKNIIKSVLSEEKKENWGKVTLKQDTLKEYFPASYSLVQMQETIIELLRQWHKGAPLV